MVVVLRFGAEISEYLVTAPLAAQGRWCWTTVAHARHSRIDRAPARR